MRIRAICDLSQLCDSELFTVVAEGLRLIIGNARRLNESANVLAEAQRYHGARVLRALSGEEAAKFLILVDALRCPRTGESFTRQLARFNDHLAKGLYARAYEMRPATLEQLQEYLDSYREQYYLDGPNNVDWIFRNEILQRREELLYVDYVTTDEGSFWRDPGTHDDILLRGTDPQSWRTAAALCEVGIVTAGALEAVAEIWRPVPMERNMRSVDLRSLNYRTLELLDSRGLLQSDAERAVHAVVNGWQFPLYDMDLTTVRIALESLRERQRTWTQLVTEPTQRTEPTPKGGSAHSKRS